MTDPCPDCGAPLGGRSGCEAAWFAFGAQRAGGPRDPAFRAAHDAWCLQHPEPYTRSLKSFYVHFLGLCVAIDQPDDPRAQAAVWNDIRVPPDAAKPPAPRSRVTVQVGTVLSRGLSRGAPGFIRAEWHRWHHAHALARTWLAEALTTRRREGPLR